MNNGCWGIFIYSERGQFIRTEDASWADAARLSAVSRPLLFNTIHKAKAFARANRLLNGVFIRPVASRKTKEGLL